MTGNVPGKIRKQQLKNVDARNIYTTDRQWEKKESEKKNIK